MTWRATMASGVLMVLLAGPAAAQAPESDTVTVNFVNADIEGVVKAVSEITGKNFVLDPRVKGSVNIVSARPMPRSLVYEVFLSTLRLHGYAAVEGRNVVKIIPAADARLHPGRMPGRDERGALDQVVTRVFTLRYESASQLLPILRPLIAPANTITAYPANNTLVITDYAGNLRRLAGIIHAIDQPSGSDAIVIPLAHASALDVVAIVNRVFAVPAKGAAGAADASRQVSVAADTRSNSLIARSDNPSRIVRLRALVAQLDSPTSAAGNLHVVHLKNAEAVKVAETLRAIYLGDNLAPVAPRGPLAPGPAAPAGVSPLLQPLAGVQPVTSSAGMIQADPATNSILINAPDAIYNNLRAVIEKLDARRAQVYVEALIAEITAEKAAEFGIQWQDVGSASKGGTNVFGGTNFGAPGQNILGIAANPGSAGRGLNIGVIRGVVSIPGVGGQILNLGMLVRALQADNNVNILSTPTLLTLDNEEARIIIGQNVPFITGQYALSGAATTPTPFQTVERRDVGLTLRVKPQISEGGTVRLQLFQEVSSVEDSSNPAGVVTNKRAVESTVLVDDGQIVVIGGLIQDSVRDGVEKVPLLGDLPLLGALFTYNTRARSKTNLMVFLRPTVLRDAHRADSITDSRYDYIRGEQRKATPPRSPPLPDLQSPELPAPGVPTP